MIFKILWVWVLVFCFSSSVLATGVDEVFTNERSWGRWVEGLFGLKNYNKSYALVVGISDYDSFDNLGTKEDPIRVARYLHEEANFDHVRLITGTKVNLNKIRHLMMDDYREKVGKDDRFLFYWSGHGVTEKTRSGRSIGYLPVFNSKNKAYSSMLDMSDLSKWDDRLLAKQTFYILDSCFSGMAGFKTKSKDNQKQTLARMARKSRQVLTAGLPDEETLVINDLGGSVFTTAVLDGWRGHADTEKGLFSRDGIVSARELELYVQERVDKERLRVGWRHEISPLLHRLEQRPGDFFFMSEKTLATAPYSLPIKNAAHLVSGVGTKSGTKKNNKAASSPFIGDLSSRYVDNGITVTDKNTRLMWKKCSEGQAGPSCSGNATRYAWEDAVNRFKEFSFAGYDDWRLPTVRELNTLVKCVKIPISKERRGKISCGSKYVKGDSYKYAYKVPAIEQKFFPNTMHGLQGIMTGNEYWSSEAPKSTGVDDQSRFYAHAVNFGDNGYDVVGGRSTVYRSPLYVRLVRKIR